MKAFIASLVVLPLAALAVGCSGGESTKAGGSAAPVTLRIGTNDVRGRPGSDQIEEFARRVARLSDRRLRIQPVWAAAGSAQADWDQKVARMVVSGKLDLGMIPSRAWDTEGVTTMRALSAPFLVTSDELSSRIVSSELGDDMLAGLEEIDLVGLALVPEGLRHPFAFDEPLLSPEGYAGTLIRAPTSDVTDALFEALGGRSDDLAGPAFDDAIAASEVAAAESSFLWSSSLPPATVATGNVTYFPKVNTIAMNAEAFDDLTDDQRAILRQAAEQTRDWAIDALPSEAEAAEAYCAEGGTVVLASDEDLAALERAAAPVYVELGRDGFTKNQIEEIRRLKQQVGRSNAAAAACRGSRPVAVPPVAEDPPSTPSGSFADGVFRAELKVEELLARGMSQQDAFDNQGLIRLTFSHGDFVISEERGRWADCHGNYRESGKQLLIHITGPGCPREKDPMRMEWALDGGELRLEPIQPNDTFTRIWWGSEPWRRIADAPAEEASFPEGVYRLSYTVDFLVERGLDRGSAFDQAAIQTLTFDNGSFVHRIEGKPPECRGKYVVEDGRVALVILARQSPSCGPEDWEIFNARWTLQGDELRFVDVRSKVDEQAFVETIWGSKPWRKIG